MKKSLLALAALSAFATAAQAQSSVSVYGIVDVNWSSLDNDANENIGTVGNGQLASSRLGFKGSEDLGGGLKANFVLEGALTTSTGTLGTTTTNQIFNRASWVGLSGGFGEIRLGKQDVTQANDIDVLVSQYGNMGLFAASPIHGGTDTVGDNRDRAVVYISPSFNGLQVQAGYATAQTTTTATTGDTTSYMISYTQGPLKLFAGQQEEKAIAAADNKEETVFGASYDAGFASFGIAMQDAEAGTNSGKQTNYSVAVPVKALGSGVKLHAGYSVNENETTANSDITTTKLAITKAMSKRTTVYAAYSSADTESTGKTPVTTTVGVTHAF